MATVSRLQLNHPALGTAGGAALHTQIENIYKKIGDNIADRFFTVENLNDSTSADLDHNFNTDLSNLRWDLYSWNTTTDEITLLTESTTPKKSDFTLAAKVGSEKTYVTLTNGSGAQQDIVVVMFNDPIELDELTNVDVSTTAPEEGQALVFNATNSQWQPGASGDSSFKLQSLTGTTVKIKKGKYKIADGRVLATGNISSDSPVDINIDLSNILASPAASTTYWLCIDLGEIGTAVILSDTGQKVYKIYQDSQFIVTTDHIDSINPQRYIPIGTLKTGASTAWTNATIETAAYRIHAPLSAFLPAIESYRATHSSASTKTVTHGLSHTPQIIELKFWDDSASVLTPMDASSYVTDVTDSDVDFDFSSLTFAANDYVDISIHYLPNIGNFLVAQSTNFKSGWMDSTSTTTLAHGLVDMDDIASYEVQEWDVTNDKRKNIDRSSLVKNFDDTNFYLDWTGLSPSSTLQYRVVTGGTALPHAKYIIEDYKEKSSAYTAEEGDYLLIDTSSSAVTVTLPANPQVGSKVIIADAEGTFDTNNVTLGRNGENIQNVADDMTLDVKDKIYTIIYRNSSYGWRVL